MKKLFVLGAFLLTVFAVNSAYSFCGSRCGSGCGPCAPSCAPCAPACPQPCAPACPPDESTGDCYCQYVRYDACPYTTKRCVEEQIPCPRKCCRYVPEYYEVQKCRYVPQYYTVTCCRQVPEYYEVTDYKTCKKVICEPQVRYVPRYYWKKECRAPSAPCAPSCP